MNKNNKKKVPMSSGPTTTRVNMVDDWGDYFRSFNSYRHNQTYGNGYVEPSKKGTWETAVPDVINGMNHNISSAQAYAKIKEKKIITDQKNYYKNWQDKIEQMEDEFDEHSDLSSEQYKSSNKAPGIKVIEQPVNSIDDTLEKIRNVMRQKAIKKLNRIESKIFTKEQVKEIQSKAQDAPDVDIDYKKPEVGIIDAITDFIGSDSDIKEDFVYEKQEMQDTVEELSDSTIENKEVEDVEEVPVEATVNEDVVIEEYTDDETIANSSEPTDKIDVEIEQEPEQSSEDKEFLDMLEMLEESSQDEDLSNVNDALTIETEPEKELEKVPEPKIEKKPSKPASKSSAKKTSTSTSKSKSKTSKKSKSSKSSKTVKSKK